eukprot:TRINITY_DN16292_c0_g1_i10.p1 TRINITY_DN16292_c0_g1~~TRINITY_DN16292_c0_g1_i10.p1  ORF type:complete len:141 (-),score=19.48 TRINITY_DN16292_c0_g1_i10:130-552(-)
MTSVQPATRRQQAWFPAEAFSVCSSSTTFTYSARRLQEGSVLAQIRAAGCSWWQCKQIGYTIPELQREGCEATQLREAGFSVRQMQDAGYTLQEMKAAGFDCYDFRAAGYTSSQCKAVGFTALQVECASCYDAGDDDWYE